LLDDEADDFDFDSFSSFSFLFLFLFLIPPTILIGGTKPLIPDEDDSEELWELEDD